MIRAYFVGGCWDGLVKTLENSESYIKVVNGERIFKTVRWYNTTTELTMIYDNYRRGVQVYSQNPDQESFTYEYESTEESKV